MREVERGYTEARIDLNDLLERAKQQKREDHKRNIMVVAGMLFVIVLAVAVVSI